MKKFVSFFLSLLLILSFGLTAAASDPGAPKVVDNAGLFTSEEQAELTQKAYDLIYEYDMDIVILTVPSLDGKSAQRYADDYYDQNGYGIGNRYSGILFLLAMEEREWYMSTCGDGMDVFPDWVLDDMADEILPYLSDGDYHEAFDRWLDSLEYYLENPVSYEYDNYDDNDYYDYDEPQRDYAVESRPNFLISIVIGLVVAAVVVLIMRASMNTARAQSGAGEYMRSGSYRLTVHRDLFLYSNDTKTPRPKDNGGRGGRF